MATEPTDPSLQDGMFRQHAKHIAARASEDFQAVRFMVQLWWLMIRLNSYPGWLLLRYNFGERFLPTGVIVVCSLLCLLAAVVSGSMLGILTGFGIFLGGCIHRIQIIRRNRRGDTWHSYDNGTTYLASRFPDHTKKIELIGEPAIVMATGLVLTQFNPQMPLEQVSSGHFFWPSAFGVYVISVGFAMLLQANKLKRDARHLLLDARDSQIDNQAFAAQQDCEMDAADAGGLPNHSSIAQTV